MRPSIFLSGATAALLLTRGLHAQATAKPLSDTEFLKLGKQYTEWFFLGKSDSLLAHMVPETREALGGAQGVLGQRDQVAARAGAETGVLVEKMTRRRGNPQFWHEGTFENLSEPLVIRWVMDEQGQIRGAGIGPKSRAPEPDSTAAK